MNWTHPRILNVKANGLRLGSILKICMLSERFVFVIIFILALQAKIFVSTRPTKLSLVYKTGCYDKKENYNFNFVYFWLTTLQCHEPRVNKVGGCYTFCARHSLHGSSRIVATFPF